MPLRANVGFAFWDPLDHDLLCMGSDSMGSDPMGSDPMESDPMGSDPMESDRMGSGV